MKKSHYGHKGDHLLEETVLWRKLNTVNSVTNALLVKLEWISCASAPEISSFPLDFIGLSLRISLLLPSP